MMKHLSAWFWDSDIWLPPNVTWADIQSNETEKYPDFQDLYLSIPMAFMFLGVRFIVERFVWSPVGRSMGLKANKPKRVTHNEVLEAVYVNSSRVARKEVRQLAVELEWTERRVDRWLRLRRHQDAPSKLTRFTEIGWQFTYYLFVFCYGLRTLWDKPWFWEIGLCFHRLPFHPIDADVWWYYLLSLAFYCSMTLRHFYDVKRKDFWQMLLHHVVTITLLTLSWACNFVRVGTLVLVVHDISDILLHGAKMLKYVGLQSACEAVFAAFVVSWVLARLVVFPGWIIYGLLLWDEPPTCRLSPVRGLPIVAPRAQRTFVRDAAAGPPAFPARYVFGGLLLGLLALHVVWTYYILLMAAQVLRAGRVQHDARSEQSDQSSSEAEPADQPAACPASGDN